MKSYYFIILFVIIIIVAFSFTTVSKPKPKEKFQNPAFIQPASPVVQTNVNDNTLKDLQSYTSPSDILLTPSPGQIASFNSLPYIDPSLEKAKYERILNVQTTLQGFLDNEADSLSQLSDPSIVLPLTTAHGDLTRLRNEVMVLQRNPGIDSSLTQNDVDEIEANLGYLQKKWRLSIYNDINNIEGFNVEGFHTSDRASLNDLNNLVTKINTTTTMLSNSGTNDPVFTARIQALNALKSQIQNIINDVQSGSRLESDIPITETAYQNFLTSVSDTSSPIPNLFKNSGLPTTLSDLFPAYGYGDVSGANLAKYLFQQYADTLFKGISWDINLHYTSEAEQNLATSLATSLNSSQTSQTSQTSSLTGIAVSDLSDNISPFASIISGLQSQKSQQATTTATTVASTSSTSSTATASKFDWHDRSNFICDAIQKSGLNPDDFGCLKSDQYVSDNFSWRGYAKMVCGRLGTSYDTGLPEACGCPPSSWKGWKS